MLIETGQPSSMARGRSPTGSSTIAAGGWPVCWLRPALAPAPLPCTPGTAAAWAEFDVACARAGYTRLGFNSRLHGAEVEEALQRFDAAALITTTSAFEQISPDALVGRLVLILDDLEADRVASPARVVGYEQALSAAAPSWVPGTIDPAQPYLIGLTSGTTGLPKGATHNQAGRAAALLNIQSVCGITQGTRSLHFLSMSNASLPVMAVFLAGGCNVISDDSTAPAIADLVEREGVTHLTMVPMVAERLVAFARENMNAFDSVESLVMFGAPASPGLLRDCFELFGDAVVYAYGSTEAPMPVIALNAGRCSDPVLGDDRALNSVGRPQGAWEVRLRPEQSPADGSIGELLVRGPGLMIGYWNDPEATEAALDEDGFYATGDLAEIDDDGLVRVAGRLRDFVITGGYNVYASEVELRLKAHPLIADAAVFGVPDVRWGEAVTAVVVLAPSHAGLAAGEIAEWVRGGLAGYKKPRRVLCVDELPRSPFGKVRKGELQERFEAEPQLGTLEEEPT